MGQLRVAEVSGLFWVVTTLLAGAGGLASDWLLLTIGPAALGLDVVILIVLFFLQFFVRRYIPAVYWLTVFGVAIVGTVGSDVFSFLLSVPTWMIAVGYGIVILGIFALWKRSAGTVSFKSITTRRQGAFYWLTVFSIFAFGTAVVDMVAQDWRVGYLLTGIAFAVLIGVTAVATLRLGAPSVPSFWIAFVLTRPLGASFGFLLALNPPDGLGYGDLLVAVVAIIVAALLVVYLAVTRRGSDKQGAGPDRDRSA